MYGGMFASEPILTDKEIFINKAVRLLYITFSRIFDIDGKREMGLSFFIFYLFFDL